MPLFGSSGSRRVELEFVGDSKQLERTLGRVETRLQKFGRNVNAAGSASGLGSSGLLGFATKGTAGLVGIAALGAGLSRMAKAAAEAEVVMGQTGVAVKQAGIDWTQAAGVIEDGATRISKASAFDDEDVLKSFQVFVRGQKDVGKSLDLASLAADVARGRYTDLESATMLVNKAAMGQVGALRRAGIQIDANATSTEALAKLQQTYAGAAKKYADSAAGSTDRLKVAWENLMESMGEQSTGPKKQTEDFLTRLLNWTDGLVQNTNEVQASWQRMLGTMSTAPKFDTAASAKSFADAFGLPALTGRGLKPAKAGPAFGEPGFKPGKQGIPVTQVSTRLVGEELDARIGGSRLVLKGVLAKEAAFLQSALKDIRLTPSQENDLKQALLGVTNEIQSIDEQIIADADDKKQAAKDAAARQKSALKASREKAVAALKAQAQAFKDQASDIKSAVLDALDFKQAKVENTRALSDAKESLRIAKMIGAPSGIRDARRQVADAEFAIKRQRIEGDPYRITDGPKGPVNTLTAGNIVININGADDPEAIARQVIARINKASKTNAGQSRGRT